MPKSLEVAVEPKVLIWARESIGRDIVEVAKKFKVSEDAVANWESGQKRPTLIQLEKLAKIVYKRPLAVFLLSEPPKEPPLPEDFRTLPLEKKKPLSSKALLAIRKARRLQSLAIDLAMGLNREIPASVRRVGSSEDPEHLAAKTREHLGIGIQTQFEWKDEKEALNEWKKAVEKQGVFIFQIGIPPEDNIRGFSLLESKPSAIVLNLRDVTRGKIFSLFHEYAHLLLNTEGICDMEETYESSKDTKLIESFCNHFAGAVLVPKNALIGHELVKSKGYSAQWPDEILEELAKSFKVSQVVILRRLVILSLADKDFYKLKHEEWRSTEYQRRGGRRNPPKECIGKNGIPFVSLVLDSYREEKITYRDVADYLNLRLKYLSKVEQLVGGRG